MCEGNYEIIQNVFLQSAELLGLLMLSGCTINIASSSSIMSSNSLSISSMSSSLINPSSEVSSTIDSSVISSSSDSSSSSVPSQHYDLQASNAESFYSIIPSITTESDIPSLQVEITPKYEFIAFDVQINLLITLTYVETSLIIPHSIDLQWHANVDPSMISVPLDILNHVFDIDVFYVEITSSTGYLESSLQLQVTDISYELPPFPLLVFPLIEDMEMNRTNADSLVSTLSTFNTYSMSYTVDTNVSSTTTYLSKVTTTQSSSKLIIDPNDGYVERIFSNGDASIIKMIDENLTTYPLKKMYQKDGIYNIDSEIVDDYSLVSIDSLLMSENYETSQLWNAQKIEFHRNGNSYYLRGTLDQLFTDRLLTQLYSYSASAKEFVVQQHYQFMDNTLQIDTYVNQEIPNWPSKDKKHISIHNSTIVRTSEITKRNFDDQTLYRIQPPDEISEVTNYTDIYQPIVIDKNTIILPYYLSYFEAGQYSFNSSYNEDLITMTFYNEVGEEIPVFLFDEYRNSLPTFFIAESGNYYYSIALSMRTSASDTSISIECHNYATIFTDEATPVPNGYYELIFEGIHDQLKWSFSS